MWIWGCVRKPGALFIFFSTCFLFHHSSFFISDFLGGPVAKTPGPQCRGPGFRPWPGNYTLQLKIPCVGMKMLQLRPGATKWISACSLSKCGFLGHERGLGDQSPFLVKKWRDPLECSWSLYSIPSYTLTAKHPREMLKASPWKGYLPLIWMSLERGA